MLFSDSSFVSTLVLLLTTLEGAWSQQFSNFINTPIWPGISDACYNALNTTVNCRATLGIFAEDLPRFNTTSVNEICTSNCLTSLQNTRQTILNGCKNTTTDVIQYWDGNVYPPTFIIDQFLYAYNLGCRKDKVSGKYCDPLFISWLTRDQTLTAAQNCSDCNLGAMQMQLNSPFGYDDEFAADFQSLTSSCSKTGYTFTKPPNYVLTSATATTTTSPSETPVCINPYTVQDGDTCDSIAQANSVSTIAVINGGSLDINCAEIKTGMKICLGLHCNTYQVKPDDTCASIISSQGNTFSGVQFLAWNPNINSLCGNLYDWVNSYICVSNPGGPVGVVTQTSPLAVSTPTNPVPKPTNAPNESNSRCGYWYTVQEGDYCDKLSIQFGITLKDFYFLNPEINSNCTNLLLGLAYCVEAIGTIETYSGYPTTSNYYTLTSASFTTTSVPSPTWTQGPIAKPTTLPKASGTKTDCSLYRNYIDVPPVVDQAKLLYQAVSVYDSPITSYINDCDFITRTYGVLAGDLLKWNPSLTNNSCAFKPGFSYCVSNGTEYYPVEPTACEPVGNNTHPNTIATCSCFVALYGYEQGSTDCQMLADTRDISVSQIMQWNPWIGSDCDTGIYAGTNSTEGSFNAVCVGVNATAPTSTAGPGPSTSTKSGATMGPTPTDTVKSCAQFYTVQSGDSCASVDAAYGITFSQFYSWNPSIGSDCHNLWVGYAYCVSGPAATTTAQGTGTAAPAPTQSGTASGCTTYYTVQSGDTCQKIQDAYGISFTTLYKWNSGIGSNCQNLWVGYGVCVAGGP